MVAPKPVPLGNVAKQVANALKRKRSATYEWIVNVGQADDAKRIAQRHVDARSVTCTVELKDMHGGKTSLLVLTIF